VRQALRPGAPRANVESFAEEVWRLSQGNPFVVLETVQAVATTDLPSEGARLHLPSRVREVILARFARLSAAGRDLASLAAVMGREFDFALLENAAGLDANATAAGLEELVRRRWLQCAGMRFDFTHDRVREAVYDRLLSDCPLKICSTPEDVANLMMLAGLEPMRHWQEILWPLRTPLLDTLCNRYLVKLWPFRWFALTNLLIARPQPAVRELC